MRPHPLDTELGDMVEGLLGVERVAVLEEHLAGCRWCRAKRYRLALALVEEAGMDGPDTLAEALGGMIGGHIEGNRWSCVCGDGGQEVDLMNASVALYRHRIGKHTIRPGERAEGAGMRGPTPHMVILDEVPDSTLPCCDYRDHGTGACACPAHERSALHPFGS